MTPEQLKEIRGKARTYGMAHPVETLELLDEIDRLNKELVDLKDAMKCLSSFALRRDNKATALEEAQQENQALRACLEDIASYDIPECLDPMIPGGIWAARIAKQALAPHASVSDKKQDGGEGT